MVTTEIRRICQQLIRKNSYRTKLDICISTNQLQGSNINSVIPLEQKCFCYDTFLKGELRIVSSSTYFVHLAQKNLLVPYLELGKIDNSINCGYSSSILLRGDELFDRRLQVKASFGYLLQGDILFDRRLQVEASFGNLYDALKSNKVRILHSRPTTPFEEQHGTSFYKYDEPQSIDDARDFLKRSMHRYLLHLNLCPSAIESITIEVLHYRSSIRITTESYVKTEDGIRMVRSNDHIFAERFTLKYF